MAGANIKPNVAAPLFQTMLSYSPSLETSNTNLLGRVWKTTCGDTLVGIVTSPRIDLRYQQYFL